MESLSDEDARQQLYNSDFEKMRAALRAELREKQVESQGGVKPLCGSQMNDKESAPPIQHGRGTKRKHIEEGAAYGSTREPQESLCKETVEMAGPREALGSGERARPSTSGETGPNPMETAARGMVERGYVVFSAYTSFNTQTGKKAMLPPKQWHDSTLANCLSPAYFDPCDNTLLINTAPSGVLVLDFDLQDGGMEQLAEWESKHGAFTGARVRTGSGGVHLYFSHQRSVEAGLDAGTPTHFAKLALKIPDPKTGKETVKKVGVDMRGVSSNGMIACPPSSYQRGEEFARYTVQNFHYYPESSRT